jgi:hypothetical protein
VRARSPVGIRYDKTVDRESAEEMLARRAEEKAAGEASEKPEAKPRAGSAKPDPAPKPAPEQRGKLDEFLWGTKRRQGAVEAAAKSATRSMASGIGRRIARGVLGSIFGGRKR